MSGRRASSIPAGRVTKLQSTLPRLSGFEGDINRLLQAINDANVQMLQAQQEPLAAYVARMKKTFAAAIENSKNERDLIQSAMSDLAFVVSAKDAPPEPAVATPTTNSVAAESSQDDDWTKPLPVYRESGAPPALCGPVPAPDDYVVPADALVAAKVGTEEDESKAMYIMARVLEFSKRKGRYEVVDVDASDKYSLPPKSVIPLPTMMPDYSKASNRQHEFEKGTRVLGMYPDTTCFYEGTVHAPPSKRKGAFDYLIEFDNDDTPTKACPARFVIATPSKGRKVKGGK